MIFKILHLISTKGALFAFLRWKKFSLASYKIMRRLQKFGVAPQALCGGGGKPNYPPECR